MAERTVNSHDNVTDDTNVPANAQPTVPADTPVKNTTIASSTTSTSTTSPAPSKPADDVCELDFGFGRSSYGTEPSRMAVVGRIGLYMVYAGKMNGRPCVVRFVEPDVAFEEGKEETMQTQNGTMLLKHRALRSPRSAWRVHQQYLVRADGALDAFVPVPWWKQVEWSKDLQQHAESRRQQILQDQFKRQPNHSELLEERERFPIRPPIILPEELIYNMQEDGTEIIVAETSKTICLSAVWQFKPVIVKRFIKVTEYFESKHFQEHQLAMQQVDSPFIVRTYGGCADKDRQQVIMEPLDGGELQEYLEDHPMMTIPMEQRLKWLHQLAEGLRLLNGLEIKHRCLQEMTLMLDSDLNVKLSNCGPFYAAIPIVLPQADFEVDDLTRWMAPECVQTQNFISALIFHPYPIDSLTVDVWTIGWMIVWMMTGNIPLYSLSDEDALSALKSLTKETLRDLLPIFPGSTPVDLYSLALDCLSVDPHSRPSIAYVCEVLRKHAGVGARYQTIEEWQLTVFPFAPIHFSLQQTLEVELYQLPQSPPMSDSFKHYIMEQCMAFFHWIHDLSHLPVYRWSPGRIDPALALENPWTLINLDTLHQGDIEEKSHVNDVVGSDPDESKESDDDPSMHAQLAELSQAEEKRVALLASRNFHPPAGNSPNQSPCEPALSRATGDTITPGPAAPSTLQSPISLRGSGIVTSTLNRWRQQATLGHTSDRRNVSTVEAKIEVCA